MYGIEENLRICNDFVQYQALMHIVGTKFIEFEKFTRFEQAILFLNQSFAPRLQVKVENMKKFMKLIRNRKQTEAVKRQRQAERNQEYEARIKAQQAA